MIKKFTQFNESLEPSQYRKYMKAGEEVGYKDRYKELFEKYKRIYSGDKHAYRIYLPYQKKLDYKSETQEKVEKLLIDLGYDINTPDYDYIKGRIKWSTAKNRSYIGKIIRRAILNGKADKQLLDDYASDKLRKSNQRSDLLVCISRHPYDIAGSDTDRKWSNCMTLFHYNKYKNACEIRGKNTRYLLSDIKQGSLVAFLINKDDKNLEDPLANIAIKPYENENPPHDIVFIPDNRIYGEQDENFKRIVFNWCYDVNKGKEGYYKIKSGLYWDNRKRLTDIEKGISFEGEDDDYNNKYAKDYLPKI